MTQATFDIERDFERQDYAAWRERVSKARKDANLERLLPAGVGELVSKVLYTASDVENVVPRSAPGQAPFTRGSRTQDKALLCGLHDEPRLEFAAQHIENDITRGMEALMLCMGPRRGIRIWNTDHVAQLLSTVDFAHVPIWLQAQEDSLPLTSALLSVVRKSGVSWSELRGGLGIDPLGWLAETGQLRGGLNLHLQILGALAEWNAFNAPMLRAASASAVPYHNAGATEAQQVGLMLATVIQYLRLLCDKLEANVAARQITLVVPISGDFFAQIAKLRAVRWLWGEVLRVSGIDPASAPPFIHAITSSSTKTKYDPWVNVVRGTAECAAAMIGEADAITVLPFDARYGHSDSFARRIARNTSLVLRHESYLDAVQDAAGGSWYVESLTDALAQAAWKEVQSIEARGGMLEALKFGYVAGSMESVVTERQEAGTTRATPIVGVNFYPNAAEKTLERDGIDEYSLRMAYHATGKLLSPDVQREYLQRIYEACQTMSPTVVELCLEAVEAGLPLDTFGVALWHGRPDLFIEPLRPLYLSEAWESLRERSKKMLAACGRRPRAWLLGLGAVNQSAERESWVRNLLEAGGIEIVDNRVGSDLKFEHEAYRNARVDFVVWCGSDEQYALPGLIEATQELRKQGCRKIVIAGTPDVLTDKKMRDAVDFFLYAGAPVLETLQSLWEDVGA